MTILQFSDGLNIDTSGALRAVRLRDGWYVVGEGYLIPVHNKAEGKEIIRELKGPGR